MIVSIIVPVYNTQDYLEECINSILNQTYDNFELLLINDGSTDRSFEICKKFANKDKRIKLINKKNEGVSITRNLGIKESIGDYIIFIDSDDYIEPDMLEVLFYGISKGVDLSVCGHKLSGIKIGVTDSLFLKEYNNSIISKEILLKAIINTSKKRFLGYSFRNLYKKEILENYKIKFNANLKISEDFLFLIEYVNAIKNIYVSSEELYNYRINEFSTTRRYIDKQHENNRYVNEYMYNKIVKNNKEYYNGYCLCESSTYIGYLNNLTRGFKLKEIYSNIFKIYYIKKSYNYKHYLKNSLKFNYKNLTSNQKISFLMTFLNLEFIYFIIYKLYDKK